MQQQWQDRKTQVCRVSTAHTTRYYDRRESDGAAEPSSKEAKMYKKEEQQRERERKQEEQQGRYENKKHRQGIYNTGQLQRYVRGWCRGGWSRASRRDEQQRKTTSRGRPGRARAAPAACVDRARSGKTSD